jgi:hypothetical protein
MQNINAQVPYAISLLNITFADYLGNKSDPITCTGFWVEINKRKILITNKHNIFPALKDKKYADKKIIEFKILLRDKNGFGLETAFVELNLQSIKGFVHLSADVALIDSPIFNNSNNFTHASIHSSDLADSEFLTNNITMFDTVGFIGYPQKWYDSVKKLPIGRIAHIANVASMPFENDGIKTGDVTSVAGLSFGGSSGSPVILFPKGIPGYETNNFKNVQPKIIGIMSGHFWDAKEHSGLSYFTRTTSVHDLIKGEKAELIINYIWRKAVA